jgi:hypothetical protein
MSVLDEFQELAGDQQRFGDPHTLTKQVRAVLQRSPHVTFSFDVDVAAEQAT